MNTEERAAKTLEFLKDHFNIQEEDELYILDHLTSEFSEAYFQGYNEGTPDEDGANLEVVRTDQ